MKLKFFPEKTLKFGRSVMAYDPRKGLLKGGPFGLPNFPDNRTPFKVIKCGIIGTPRSIAKTKNFIECISAGIGAEKGVYSDLGFPGLGTRSPLQFSLCTLRQWESRIVHRELTHIRSISDFNLRKDLFIDMLDEKMQEIKMRDPPPDIIFVALDSKMLRLFKDVEIKDENIIFANRNNPESVYQCNGDINFHSIVKVLGMKHEIPTQVIKSKTLDFKANEPLPTVAWNFCVAQYYKAKGIPWKFSELPVNTCYVGISFYRDFSYEDPYMGTSMAQVFLDTGESFVLRGESIHWDQRRTRSPRLDRDQMRTIIDKVLQQYHQIRRNYPQRVVVFKTSNFTDDEMDGLYSNRANIDQMDMVTVHSYPSLRLYRMQSEYPVMRGTALVTSDNSRCYLFTSGFIPSLGTYPGSRVPVPLEVRLQEESISDIEQICHEIMILTRLDWNNVKFHVRLPTTLAFSRKIGNILAEKRASEVNIQSHYRFYM